MAPPANNLIMSGTSIRSFTHLEHQNPYIISGDIGRAKSNFSFFTQGCLVQIFTTWGVVAPPANSLIMSGTLIHSFRHLEHQTLSIISGDIGTSKSKFSIFTQGCLVQIFTTRGVVAQPASNLIMLGTSIQSFRPLEHQNLSIII